MAEVVVATLNIGFEDDDADAQGNLKLEIDDREDGLNGGETNFKPGDDAYFFMFKDDNVSLITTTPKNTAGGVSPSGTGEKVIDENISFSNTDSGSLGYPPAGAVVRKWLGRSYVLSGTTLTPNSALPEVSGSELKMSGGKKVIGVLNCTYTATGSLWKLSGVPDDIPEVMVIAIGTY